MNSRFAALIEEPVEKKKVPQPPLPQRTHNQFRDNRHEYKRENRTNYSSFKSQEQNVKKSVKISIDDLEMFPTLGNLNIQPKDTTNDITFMDKLKTVHEQIEDNNPDILRDGWISLRRDENNEIIYDNNKFQNNDDDDLDWETISKKLNENYEQWKQKYINTWGHDEFEKMYKFPNYDYYYFDKLDEEYEKEMTSMFYDEEGEASDYYDNVEYDNDDYY